MRLCLLAAVIAVFSGCSPAPDEQAGRFADEGRRNSPDSAYVEETQRTAGVEQETCDSTSLVTGNGVGALRIGADSASLRLRCRIARSYEAEDEEGTSTRYLDVDFGRDTIRAELDDVGAVWRIEVDSPRFVSADSLGVGKPLSRLLNIPGLSGAEGEGSLYVMSENRCGLSFRLGYTIPDGDHRDTWTLEHLADIEGDPAVSRILVFGC